MSYCAVYKSSKSGCLNEILSSRREQLNFAQSVNSYCEKCKTDHRFNLVKAYATPGESLHKRLLETAKSMHWQLEKEQNPNNE